MASIYIIENKDNGKRYVGKTTLSDPYDRWRQHKYNAKSKWCDMAIGRAINKYGIDNFTFYVIETCNDDNINERETYWIEKFNTYYDGYNSTFGGEGVKRDIELAYHPNTKPVSCYTLEGEWIKDYKSKGVAARELGLKSSQTIVACIKGVTFQAGGYRWSWKDEELVECNKRENTRGKIYGIDKDGNRKEWNSQADCAEEIEGNRKKNANVRTSIVSPNNNKTHCKGWYLFREHVDSFIPAQKNAFTSEEARKYGLMSKGSKRTKETRKLISEKNKKRVYGINKITRKQTPVYKSINEAARKYVNDSSGSGISKSLKNPNKNSWMGYYWFYFSS